MKYLRVTAIAVALAAVSIGFGAASAVDNNSKQDASFCQRCGDGICVKSCENAQTCPRDCGGGGGGTTAH
jgi:hypothetical protein